METVQANVIVAKPLEGVFAVRDRAEKFLNDNPEAKSVKVVIEEVVGDKIFGKAVVIERHLVKNNVQFTLAIDLTFIEAVQSIKAARRLLGINTGNPLKHIY